MVIDKSPEVIEAQIAAFAQNALDDNPYKGERRSHVMSAVGELATATAQNDLTYEHTAGLLTKTTKEYTIEGADYVDYLRRTGGANNPEVQDRAKYLMAYREFEPDVAPVVAGLQQRQNRTKADSALGHGLNATVFPFSHGDKQYIAKVPNRADNGASEADGRFRGLRRVENIQHPNKKHLEQLTAMSYTDGVAIMERLPGTDMDHTPLEAAEHVTDEQLEEALVTMHVAQEAGVDFDPSKASNYMYSPTEGFGFVDLNSRGLETYSQKVTGFATALSNIGVRQERVETRAEYELEAKQAGPRRAVLEQFRDVCLRQPDQENYKAALATLDRLITHHQTVAQNVATPGWLDEHLAKETKKRALLNAYRQEMKRNTEGVPTAK